MTYSQKCTHIIISTSVVQLNTRPKL